MNLGQYGGIIQNALVKLTDVCFSAIHLNEYPSIGVSYEAFEIQRESTPVYKGSESDTLHDPLKVNDCTDNPVHLGKPLENPIEELIKTFTCDGRDRNHRRIGIGAGHTPVKVVHVEVCMLHYVYLV